MASTLKTIVLVRHAPSLANVDPNVYCTTPDHAIALARPDDDASALSAGQIVGRLGMPPDDTCCWSSTYLRCKQTEALVTRGAFPSSAGNLRRRESFLLREQEFGDWDGLSEAEIEERYPGHFEKRRRMTDALGRFYFRFPNGESRADVVQRVTIFLGKMHRTRYNHHLVFLHGVTQRAFRMAWFDHPPEWFETEPNPKTASVLLIRRDETGRWMEHYLDAPRTGPDEAGHSPLANMRASEPPPPPVEGGLGLLRRIDR
jgi:2,3-bisphosphoglycerate-dependent phosphoglycerate mutase